MAHKLAEALGAPTAGDDLELVALATVADLVPLTGENRRLVREGLRALSCTAKPGLRALMSVTRSDPSALTAGTVGFRLAPRINAAGRLRRADAGLELLLTEDPARAQEIALELDAVNAERRAVEQRILWQAEEQVADLGERSAYVLAGRGLAPRSDRDRRLADRRAPSPARRCSSPSPTGSGPARAAASPALTCSAGCTPQRDAWSATEDTGPRPG